jgi:hypothetical protein
MSTNPSPDQYAEGVTAEGLAWSLARYGTLVVTRIGDDGDDIELASPEDARREFAALVGALTEPLS